MQVRSKIHAATKIPFLASIFASVALASLAFADVAIAAESNATPPAAEASSTRATPSQRRKASSNSASPKTAPAPRPTPSSDVSSGSVYDTPADHEIIHSPRATPIPISTPEPIATPEPYATATPTPTPLPDGQPKPVATPEPTPEPTPVPKKSVIDTVTGVLGDARARRAASSVVTAINWAPLDLIIPSKFGATVGYLRSPSTTYEVEYLGASIKAPKPLDELGQVSEKRISLLVRSFGERETFNFHYGISYFDLDMHVGSAILSRATSAPEIDLIRIQALGLAFGIGNRWTFAKNITAGVDWLAWEQPLFVLKRENGISQYLNNQSDKDTLETAMKIASYLPRFTLLKVQLGIGF